MRELERILEKTEVILCAPMLLAYAHKQCETVGTCVKPTFGGCGVWVWLPVSGEKSWQLTTYACVVVLEQYKLN